MCVCEEGGNCFRQIWVKMRKIVGWATLLFLNCAKVSTRVEGGSEAPIRGMLRWDLQVNHHGTSFIKINFNPRVCFTITFSHSFLYRPYVRETDFRWGYYIKWFNRKAIRQFFTWYSEATNTLWFCEKMKNKSGDVSPSTFLCGLTAGKTFQREAKKPCCASMPHLYQCFNHRF